MKRILIIALTFISLGMAGLATTAPSVAFADAKADLCTGANTATGQTGCADTSSTISKTVRNMVNLFSTIIGIVAVVMIMVSGFRYITANGDTGQITSARQTIMYAIVGLIIVAVSQSLVHFVLNRVAG